MTATRTRGKGGAGPGLADAYSVRPEDLIYAVHSAYLLGFIEGAIGESKSVPLCRDQKSTPELEEFIDGFAKRLAKARARDDGTVRIPALLIK